jgi:thioredoxin 1
MTMKPTTTTSTTLKTAFALLTVLALALPAATQASGDSVASASDISFHDRVLSSPVPVLVEFWAPWCVPCRHLEKSLETVASELGSRARIVRVNIRWNTVYAKRYNVTALPTMIIFRSGEMVDRVTGALSPAEIRDLIHDNSKPVATAVVASINER